MYRIYVEFTFF